jgi:hypothetical protein
MTLNDLNKVLKTGTQQEEGFKEVCRWKRHNTEEAACAAKKAAIPTSSTKVTTKSMNTDAPGTESSTAEELVQGKASRPPPIVLTSATNLIHLQKQLKGVAKQQFRVL